MDAGRFSQTRGEEQPKQAMKERIIICVSLFLMLVACGWAAAQTPTPSPTPTPECSVPIFKAGEVDRKIRILKKPEPKFVKEDLRRYRNSKIILQAIFCGSGKVTDIRVQQGLTDQINEDAVEAARNIEFTPAEKNGEKVSLRLTIEYRIEVSP